MIGNREFLEGGGSLFRMRNFDPVIDSLVTVVKEMRQLTR